MPDNRRKLTDSLIDELVMDNWPKGEKIANKDIKLRTFISQESGPSPVSLTCL
jgi:hypothetical protein